MLRHSTYLASLLAVLFLLATPGWAQSSDPQAVTILAQSLNAVGGAQGLGSVRDFVATGTIAYFWAGEPVQGSATVRARGFDQFRLDANLPEGTRSFVVNRGVGALKGTDGIVTQVPYHNTVNLGTLTFPYLNILAALDDSLTTASYVGLVDLNGRQVYQVRVQRHFSPTSMPTVLSPAFASPITS